MTEDIMALETRLAELTFEHSITRHEMTDVERQELQEEFDITSKRLDVALFNSRTDESKYYHFEVRPDNLIGLISKHPENCTNDNPCFNCEFCTQRENR